MKIKFIVTAASLAWCAALSGATLSVPTAVQSQPDPASSVIAVLKAGSEQPAPTDKVAAAPAGWTAVEVSGPFEGYVKNKDLTKQLDVIPGASIYVGPKDGSGVLATFAKGDKAEITGLHGGWTQIRLDKTLIGYIQAPAPAVAALPAAPMPAPAAANAQPVGPAAAPSDSSSVEGGGSVSKLFEGTLATTRSLLSPKRPFDWQLVDPDGNRIAYVDLSRLLLTDQIENYAGHQVVVLGSLKTVAGGSDLAIDAEGLRLK